MGEEEGLILLRRKACITLRREKRLHDMLCLIDMLPNIEDQVRGIRKTTEINESSCSGCLPPLFYAKILTNVIARKKGHKAIWWAIMGRECTGKARIKPIDRMNPPDKGSR